MAQIMQVLLSKGDSPNLGFRLQGGKDFGTPLVIQKVNGGSPAEKAGLIAGDAVIKINNTDVFNLRHKDAQDVIIRSGPSFEITVQRGGSTWKPSVQMEGSVPAHKPQIKNVAPVTKTSLAARNPSNVNAIGTGHNVAAKPFAPQLNGSMNGSGPKLVNKQYNSPLGLYSEESIADTLSAQTEVLATGALGVNFKKNEKNFDVSKSAVLSILQEAEREPQQSHYETEPDSGIVRAPSQAIVGLRVVTAPETKIAPAQPQLPPGQNICADCERLIVGVFVRIKDKNLHVECFKCSTCGSSLKNVGYYNINNKLYCDVHAKLAAKNNPPAANLVPLTIPPGSRSPSGTISASLGSHSLPSPGPLSPRTSNTSAAPFQAGSHFSSPRPFASVTSPIIAPPTNINSYPGPSATNLPSKIFTTAAAPSLSSPSIIQANQGSFSAKPGVLKVQEDDALDTDDIIHTVDMIIPLNNQINVTVPLTHKNPASNIIIEDGLYQTSDIAVTRRCATPKSAENRVSYLETDFSTISDANISLTDAITISITPRQSPVKYGTLSSFSSPCVSPIDSLQSSSPRFHNTSDSFSRPLSPVIFISDNLEPSDKARRFVCSNNNLEETICCICNGEIERGPFISALGKFWCPDHFICATPSCRRPLQDVGFVEEQGKLYCEFCFEQYLAPNCAKCNSKIKADCLRAIQKHFHPECFKCTYCSKQFGNTPFFLEDGLPYCQDDWNELFTTKCFACGFPVEAGDRWVEALNNNYHTQCFNCSMCKKNLEGQSFFAKGGRPFCKNHAR